MTAAPPAPRSSLVHVMLAITVATGGVVWIEPAPYDLLMLLTVAVGPLFLWPSVRSSLALPYLLVALLVLANGLSLMVADELRRGLVFFGVTAYLLLAWGMIVAWLDRCGMSMLQTLLSAYAVAAGISGAIAVAAYFHLIPGAALMLPKGRLQGLFKDANVFGAFMVTAVVLAVAQLASHDRHRLRWLMLAAVGMLSVLLSYSRGSWINLGIGLLSYTGLRLVSGRVRPTLGTVVGTCLVLAGLGALLIMVFDHPAVREMLELRASTQRYDDDRFANQAAALELAWEEPLGIGPGATEGQFKISAHSLYVRSFVENGLLGLWATVGLMVVSQARVIWAALRASDPTTQRLLTVVAAVLAGTVIESAVIDTVHWRHMWLLLALAWAPRREPDAAAYRTGSS